MMRSVWGRCERRARMMFFARFGSACRRRQKTILPGIFGSTITAIAVAALLASPASAGPMQLDGKFAVSESGGATYHIPIAVPPGTAGMMPNLSLDYDSQRGSGIVGVGWSLNGFSAIRRCAQTVAQDNLDGRIGYDANDRYCLDGQRLMAVAGTNGADLTEYRTELESFKKAISHGTAGTGPSWFEVRLPSGRVLEYGNTTNSKILAKGKTSVRVWALNKITDTKGNYLTVTYNNDTANGTYYPTSIDYTGNAGAALTPYASVQFSYAVRPTTDQVLAYTAGSTVKLTQRLSEIKTYTGGTQVLSYKLTYETGPNSATGVARLASIQMCDAANLCQPATTFTWSNAPGGTVTYGAWGMWLAAPGTAASSKPAVSHTNKKKGWKKTGSAPALEAYESDIDGDGRADVLINNNAAILVTLSTGTGFTAPVSTGIITYSPQLIDIFGTGRNDIVSLNASNQLVRYANNGNGGFNTTPTVLASPGVGHPVFPDIYTPIFSDINGDGLPDMVWHNSTNVFKFALNTGSGFAAAQTITAPSAVKAKQCTAATSCKDVYATVTVQFADLRGRGNVDLVYTFNGVPTITCTGSGDKASCTSSGDPAWQVWYATWTGTGYSAAVKVVSIVHDPNKMCGPPGERYPCPKIYPSLATTRIADVNGDSLSDLFISYPAASGEGGSYPAGQVLYVGNGNGFNASVAAGLSATSCPTGLVFRDIYGSGRTDAACQNDTAIRISRPNAAATNFSALVNLSTAAATGDWWLKDFNGDGHLDILVQRATNNNYWVALSNRVGGAPTDLLTGITTGLGAITTITYEALSSNASANGQPVYTRGSSGAYPTVDEVPDTYVVTKVERANGIGGVFSTGYRYAGAQRDLRGRGSLGLTQVIATDLGTDVETTTSYRLNYPFTGLIASDVKSLGSTILANATNTYAATSLGGTRFLPFLTDSLMQGADLDGSALPSVTTTYQYDAFGNPTLVTATSSDGFGKIVSNTYTNDTVRWILGLPTQSQVTSSTP